MKETIVNVNEANFNKIIAGKKPVLMDFWAEWCGYCKLMEPILERLAEKYGDGLVIGRINADDNYEIARRFDVMGLPTFILFMDGKARSSSIGAKRELQFEEWIGSTLASAKS